MSGRVRDVSTDAGTGLSSLRRYTWWAVPGSATVFLLFVWGLWVIDPDVSVWARGVGGVGVIMAVTGGVVLLSQRLAPRRPPTGLREWRAGLPLAAWLAIGSAAATVAGAAALAMRNYGLWSFAPAWMLVVAATFLPQRRRLVLIAAGAAVAAVPGGVVSVLSGDGEAVYAAAFPVGMVAFIAWITLGPLWAWDVAGQLDHARRLEAELAVKDERLRFAADLHDIQGHHLQVIALKGELAARLVEADPTRAAAEMKEVQRLANDALTDTRAVVQGYRRTTLDEEIVNATRILAAAGVDARMNLEPEASTGDRLPASSRHLLGLVMREATTNVLRHSQARHADVDYRVTGGQARLRVRNDGAMQQPAAASGSGLRGLAERLQAAGGELAWEHDGDSFVVSASLPLRPSDPEPSR